MLGGALAVIGLLRFDISDDLRRFQSLAPELRSAEAEIRRISDIDLAPAVLMGLAAREFAGKIETIEHLNLTPDLLGSVLTDLLAAGTRRLEAGTGSVGAASAEA